MRPAWKKWFLFQPRFGRAVRRAFLTVPPHANTLRNRFSSSASFLQSKNDAKNTAPLFPSQCDVNANTIIGRYLQPPVTQPGTDRRPFLFCATGRLTFICLSAFTNA